MTQEELDALMDSDLEEVGQDETDSQTEVETQIDDSETEVSGISDDKQEDHYRAEATASWPPPPPTNDHQVVNQLDDVTKDSEVKATEIFDKLENINTMTMTIETLATEQKAIAEKNIDIFERLTEKFSQIESFKEALSSNQSMLEKCDAILSQAQGASDEVMMTMDVMQYQDIHRQKIERVINVMRALSGYMNSLFASNVDDDKRVGSAIHIDGDGSQEVVNSDDIEALIASFGQK